MKKIFINLLLLLCLQIAALAQTGTLDPTFGNGGIVDTTGGSTIVSALQTDGKILTADISPTSSDIRVMRFLQNGTIDLTFGINGIKVIEHPGSNETAKKIAIQPDGKIIIAGDLFQNYPRIFACRLNVNGNIDSSFAVNGKFIHTFQGVDHYTNGLNLSADGKIWISGHVGFPEVPFHLRLNTDGSLDNSFGTNGAIFTTGLGFAAPLRDSRILSDGKIVFTFRSDLGGQRFANVVRIFPDGNIDSSFGINGVASRLFTRGATSIKLILQNDGKIFIGGTMGYGTASPPQEAAYILRFLPNGSIDNSFGTSGIVQYNNTYGTACYDFLLQPSDNKIVLLGYKRTSSSAKNRLFITRLNNNGVVDSEFGEPGTISNITKDESFNSGLINPEGGIIAVGYGYSGSTILAKYISCANSITVQPQDISREEGNTATFTAGSSSASAIYQWQVMGATDWENLANGGQYAGVQTATLSISNLTPSNNGATFRAISTSGVCVDTSGAAVLTVTPPNSITSLDLAKHFTVYPNPVKNKLSIKGDLPVQSVKVSDILGREQFIFEAGGQQNIEIDLAKLSPGLYWISINTIKGTGIIKVVKE